MPLAVPVFAVSVAAAHVVLAQRDAVEVAHVVLAPQDAVEVAHAVLVRQDAAAVGHAVLAASSPGLVLYEPVAAVVAVELPRDAAVAVVAVALPRVHLAAAVALVALVVRLLLRQPNVQRAAAGAVRCLHRVHRVAVAPQHEPAAVPRLAVVPRLAAVPLFVLPQEEVPRGPDARLAPGTSVPWRDPAPDSHASPWRSPAGTVAMAALYW